MTNSVPMLTREQKQAMFQAACDLTYTVYEDFMFGVEAGEQAVRAQFEPKLQWAEQRLHGAKLLMDHVEAERDAARAQVARLREALESAEMSLFSGARMLQAICETDETQDRRHMANRLSVAARDARTALQEQSHE